MKINEIFLSIQGEGLQSGLPTTFIRTTGCNLRCEWCDTQYAYSEGTDMSLEEIVEQCEKYKTKNICLTGGEPLVQAEESYKIIKMLLDGGYSVLLETNGSITIENIDSRATISLDVKCPSSGETDKNIFANFQFIRDIDQVKFVIEDAIDYEYSKKVISEYNLEKKTNVIFQPAYDENAEFTKKLAQVILEDNLNVRMCLQIHKIIWGEQRGV